MGASKVYQGVSIPDAHSSPEVVSHFIESAYPVDIATFIENVELEIGLRYLLAIELERRAEVFSYISLETQVEIARLLKRNESIRRINDIYYSL